MKILFAGDASNMHNCLAQQLRKMGHHAVVASGGSNWMNCGRDINLHRGKGKLSALAYLAKLAAALPKMRGFDVVEIAGPIFFELRPERIRVIFDYLKKHNGKIVLSALCTDHTYYTACHDGHTYRYSDYLIGDKPSPYVHSKEYAAQLQDNWKKPFMKEHSQYVLQRIDGVIACLWEYYAAYEPIMGSKLAYAGIPIDTDSIQPHLIEEEPEMVKFFIGIQPDRTIIKGTDRLLAAAKKIVAEMPHQCQLTIAERLPYNEYVQRMNSSHVMLDQLYSYTPATNALLAMAQGMIAVSGAEPEYYALIHETSNHPIVNVCPTPADDIEQKLRWIVTHKHLLPQMSRDSRAFVLKHNAAQVVVQRHLDFLQSL